MSPRLTVIGLHFAPEPTGNAPYTTYLASHLAEAGWAVTVITGCPHYPQWQVYDGYSSRYQRETAGKADVLHLRHYVPKVPRLLSRLLMELHFGIRASFVDWRDPDVVLFVTPALFSTALASVTAKRRYRKARTAVWVQDIYARGLEESHASSQHLAAPVRAVETWVLRAADRIFVIHERFQEHMMCTVDLPASNVEVIRNWSHLPAIPYVDKVAARKRFGWKDDDIIVLHAGNMGVKQNLENVVEAARLAERRGSAVRFVLLGGGNQRKKLEELGAGVSRLQFIDPLPDNAYTEALVSADVLLVNEKPGVRDMAVPSKLTSYFMTGRPILTAVEAASATAEEAKLSGACKVVPSGKPSILLQAAEALAEDAVTASRIGANGPRFAEANLSPTRAVSHWDTALRKLVND